MNPQPPEDRNAVEDAAKSPREAYREEDIVHDDDNNDSNDGNIPSASPSMLLQSREEDIEAVAAVLALPLW